MTTWRAIGFATPRSSTSGGWTAMHARAPTRNLSSQFAFRLDDIVPGLGSRET